MEQKANFVALLALMVSVAAAQLPPARVQPPSITTERLPQAVVGEPYFIKFQREGGVPPFKWTVVAGSLPQGVTLDEAGGELSGAPVQTGEFQFTVQLADSAQPSRPTQRQFRLPVLSRLTIDWKQFPSVQGTTVAGAVKVSNNTENAADLTVIIVAVNEIGKAFALAYQHFVIQPRTLDVAIPFGSTVPPGAYVVHADAVGEVASSNAIYRARIQTPGPLIVQ